MFLVILSQVFKMFLLMMAGYLCCRAKIVDHEGNKTLSNLLLMIINPFLIINAFQMEYTPSLMKGFVISFLLGMLTHGVGILITQLLIQKTGNPDYSIERFSGIYSNCGFMGIPLISCILGNEGVLYMTAYMITFNLLVWTHGLILMTGNTTWAQLKKGLTSPVMFGILAGLILFVTQIRLPAILADTISYLSALNTPIGMMIAGIALAETSLLQALQNPRLYLTTALKLLLIPALMLVVLALLPISSGIRYAVLVAAACPTATTGTMFALRYDNNYQYASEIFAFSTLASMFTIPLMIYAAEHFIF